MISTRAYSRRRMDGAPLSSPDIPRSPARPRSASASEARPARPADILTSAPRFDESGEPVSYATVLAMSSALSVLGAALSSVAGVPCRVEQAPAGSCADPEFGVRWGAPGGAGGWLLGDPAAGRALADAALARAGLAIGTGRLTPVELGVLEFVARTTADAAARSDPAVGSRFLVHSVAARGELEPGGVTDAPAWRITIGSRQGMLYLTGGPAALGSGPAPRDEPADGTGVIDLAIELPPVPLSQAEQSRAAPGDLVLLDVSGLDRSTPGLSLTTPSGWRVATAHVVSLTPTRVEAELGALDIRPSAAAAPGRNNLIRPLLGSAGVPKEDFEPWFGARGVMLTLDAGPMLRLFRGQEHAGDAELVRHEGLLAARLLRWTGGHP